jgi:RNA polymerase sigma-B factor
MTVEAARCGPDVTTQQADRCSATAELWQRAKNATGQERSRIEDEILRLNLCVADSIAARYRGRGESLQDLRQAAYMGLLKAVRRFDPASENNFLVYAVPTISGEVKRYFRDCGWVIRPPRRIQDMQWRITRAAEELHFGLQRSPTPSELATHLDVDVRDVIEGLAATGCFRPTSLDLPTPAGGDGAPLCQLLVDDDGELAARETALTLQPAIDALSERDRYILDLRINQGWTQQAIADEVGLTQMAVSRALSRIRKRLRGAVRDLP